MPTTASVKKSPRVTAKPVDSKLKRDCRRARAQTVNARNQNRPATDGQSL
jgi:hypothetical protein